MAKSKNSQVLLPRDEKPSDLLKEVKRFRPINHSQEILEQYIENKDVIFVTGAAGVGKTYAALWIALNIIKDKTNHYEKLLLSKSAVQIKGEEIGFIPGDIAEKLDPIMYSFTANIDKITGLNGSAKKMQEKNLIEWKPIAFLRGCQFDNSIVILDEAQNLNIHAIKTILTRLGKTSKLIIMGDLEQYDRNPNSSASGFEIAKNIIGNTKYSGCVDFLDSECVRNPIITDIVKKLRENGF